MMSIRRLPSHIAVRNESPHLGWVRRVTWFLLAIAVATASLPAAGSAQARTFKDFRSPGVDLDRENPDAARIRRLPDRELTPAARDLPIEFGDTLTVQRPWVMQLELDLVPGVRRGISVAEVAVSSEGAASDDLEADADGGRVVILKNRLGGSLVYLLAGALFIQDWSAGAHFCMTASAAAVCNQGTSYAVTVDRTGMAQLAVSEDAVEIRWWGTDGALIPDARGELDTNRLGRAARAIDVDAMLTSDDSLVVVVAQVGTVWEWSNTIPPREVRDRDAVAIHAVVKDMGRDIWRDPIYKKWWFWTPPVAVAACLIFDIWICGGDVSGNVILNPSR